MYMPFCILRFLHNVMHAFVWGVYYNSLLIFISLDIKVVFNILLEYITQQLTYLCRELLFC